MAQMQLFNFKNIFYFCVLYNTQKRTFHENIFYPKSSIFIHMEFVHHASYLRLHSDSPNYLEVLPFLSPHISK